MAAATQRAGESKKKIVDVVSHALRHKTRVAILIILNEGTFTTGQIAHILGETVKHVSNHVRELLDAGSIEVAKEEDVRNTPRYWYRAVELPHYTDAEVAEMTDEEVQITSGLTIQSMIAEILAGLRAGKMPDDPRLWIGWDWFNVDQQGRTEIADEQEASWGRIRDIEVAAINRCVESGEETTSILVTQTGFPRARKGPNPPDPSTALD